MTDLEKAARMALEAMGLIGADLVCDAAHHKKADRHGIGEPCPVQARWHHAFAALRQALEQPAQQQEPVAWVREHELPLAPGDAFSWVETFVHKTPLYTSPPASKQWVSLTDKEITRMAAPWFLSMYWSLCNTFARDIEAKLKEKNNG